MDNRFLDISSIKIAIVEAVLVTGALYASSKTDNKVAKASSIATAIYLAYGAYLNTQGRVKVLKG